MVLEVRHLGEVLDPRSGALFEPEHLVVSSGFERPAHVAVAVVGPGGMPVRAWTNDHPRTDGDGLHAVPHTIKAIVLAHRPDLARYF
jgi:hypothetical protein